MITKICTKCKIEYPATTEYFYANKWHKYNLTSMCKKCCKKAQEKYRQSEKGKQTVKKHRNLEKTKQNHRNKRYQRKFGITLKEYDKMIKIQRGRCKICSQLETRKRKGIITRLCIDHDHKTDKVRGLLCNRCNVIVGKAKDNIKIFENVIKYLRGFD